MSKSNVCYRCGLPGHYAPDCPNNGKASLNGQRGPAASVPQVTKEDYLKMREEDASTLNVVQHVAEMSATENNDFAQALYTLLCELRDRMKKIEENSGNILPIIGRVENVKTLLDAGESLVKRMETFQQQHQGGSAAAKKKVQSTLKLVGTKRTRALQETSSENADEEELLQ